MKRPSFLKRFAIVLLALLMALSLLLTGCSAEEVDLAIDNLHHYARRRG